MTTLEPQLWAERPAAAVEFYRSAFGADVLMQVGNGDDIVARLEVGGARFWVSTADESGGRHQPATLGGSTGRLLLVAEDVDEVDRLVAAAVDHGAELRGVAQQEHGWYVGRVRDPAGHEWEVGVPTG